MPDRPRGEPASDAAHKYWAFISYSHRDETWARWLHKALEGYAIPRALVGTQTAAGVVPRRLFPVFRDTEELPSAASLSDAVQQALRESRNLVVICSPHAAASIWVEREILFFKTLGRESRILTLVVDGEPGASADAASGQPEAFPRALRFRVEDEGQTSERAAEPLAADVRRKAPRRHALLKLVAGLIAVDFDALVRRDARARRWRRVQWAVAASVVLAIGIGAWYQQRLQTVQQADVSDVRGLMRNAAALIGREGVDFHTGVLLAVEAVHRGLTLGEPPEQALQIVRDGLNLLPEPVSRQLEGAPAALASAELSPDGRWVAAVEGRTVSIWDSRSGRRVARLTLADDVLGLAFPAENGHIVAMTERDVQTWSVRDASLVTSSTYAAPGGRLAAVSRDGRWLAALGEFGVTLTIVDLSTGLAVHELMSEIPVHLVRFSPDGALVVGAVAEMTLAGAHNAGIQVWNRETGALAAQTPHQTYVESLAVAPGTRRLATVSGATIRLIDAETGLVLRSIKAAGTSAFEQGGTVAISAEGRWVATGDGVQVRVWDAARGDLVAKIPGRGAVSGFSEDGAVLLTADGASWRMNSDAQLGHAVSSVDGVQGLAMAGAPLLLAHGSQPGPVHVWDLDSGRAISRIDEQSQSRVVAMDPTGRLLVVMSGLTRGGQWTARVWDARSGRKAGELSSPSGVIQHVAFNPDGRTVWVLFEGASVVAFETEQFRPVRTVPVPEASFSLSFSPDGRRLTVGGDGGRGTVIEVPEASVARARQVRNG
jgi:WD40 repeat protein